MYVSVVEMDEVMRLVLRWKIKLFCLSLYDVWLFDGWWFFLSSINLFGFGKLPFYFLLFSIFSHSVFVYVCHIWTMWICWIHTILIMPNENSPPASFIRIGISKQRIERSCETTCQTYLLAISPEISMELNIVNKFLSVPKHNKNWNQNRMIIYCVMSLERIQIKREGDAVSVRTTGTGTHYTHEMYWLRAAWCTRVYECACVLCVFAANWPDSRLLSMSGVIVNTSMWHLAM